MKLKALLLLSLTLLVVSCRCTQTQAKVGSKIQISTKSGIKVFDIEIADTPNLREQGLMHRESLPASSGMLFIFDSEAHHSFWMKNTILPLDLIFFDSDWTAVGIIENLTPFSQETRSINRPSRYVLELNAGSVKSSNIALGDVAEVTLKER